MSEEQRLMYVGFPAEDAESICQNLRKIGYDLERFVASRESEYRIACAEIVKEAMD